MPWEVGDVERFKKGLTAAQKKKWCAIANAVLADCQESGKHKNCEAMAAMTANSRVGKQKVG